ncbi:hypothetical protein O6H91_04G078600 [Diphasiastrum complanatum]|uniref:Uncharacterized protein n=1 Tax=Diphasiastrum complanatum TaxID=34168 RepID=A0ACC2DYJ1_DIPCM|nr:hypothetical protein O6H91_04G078600 [Diphasiastrum complanatum]
MGMGQCSGSVIMCLPSLDGTGFVGLCVSSLERGLHHHCSKPSRVAAAVNSQTAASWHHHNSTTIWNCSYNHISYFSSKQCSLTIQCADTGALQQEKDDIEACRRGQSLVRIPATSNRTSVRKPQPQPKMDYSLEIPLSEVDGKRAFAKSWQEVKNPFKKVGEIWEKDKQFMRHWLREVGKEVHIARVFEKDKKVLADGVNFLRKSSVSTLAEVLSLRIFEDPCAVPKPPQPWPRPFYPGLSGKALVAADISTTMAYFKYIKEWFAIWGVPLQNRYDPRVLASYFNRRPHVVVFRTAQVCAAFSLLYIRLNLDKLIKSPFKKSEEDDGKSATKVAERFKEVVLKLGPTFIKVAQSLSTRPDFIGPDSAKVLAELQDQMPPFSNQEAMGVLEKELGFPVTNIFEYLSEDPIAAASLGQVYKGRTKDGQDVAVKIQRPDVLYSVSCDIYILRLGLALVRKLAKINSDLSIFADEVGRGLYGELDYTLEASNASEFAAALSSKLDFVVVPRAILHLTTRRVLTMEWINGVRPLDLQRIAKGKDGGYSILEQHAAKERLLNMVNKGVQSSLTQLLDVGILHADPHPGNMLYTSNNNIGYLDFGLICRMERKHQYAMIAAVAHLVNGEWGFLTDDLAEMDVLKPTTDWFGVRLALEDAFSGLVMKNGLPDFRFSQMAGKLFKIALKFRFQLPAYYTLVLRSIASLEGMALAVDPNFKVFARTYPFVLRRLLHDNSPPMRCVLRSLLLNSKREFRWDRISAFVTVVNPISSTVATGTSDKSTQNLMTSMWKIMTSKDGIVIRRILLEADTPSLAEAFISEGALTFRQKAAALLADSFFQSGKKIIGLHPIRDRNWTVPDDGSRYNAKMPNKEQMVTFQLYRALRVNKSFQFFISTIFQRLQATPLLLLRVGWTGLTIFSTALSLSLHRLCVLLSDIYCEPVHSAKQVQTNSLISV